MSDTTKREREIAAKFYFYGMPAYVEDWVETGAPPTDPRLDEDVVGMAETLAAYRKELANVG